MSAGGGGCRNIISEYQLHEGRASKGNAGKVFVGFGDTQKNIGKINSKFWNKNILKMRSLRFCVFH
jgi:hypothetical protein